MMRGDVAIPSFRKPEALIFALLTLHRHCRNGVGTVWIGDDMSGMAIPELYRDITVHTLLAPWRIIVPENHRHAG